MLRHPRPVALAISNRRVIWLRLCGAIAIAGLIFASLLLPAEWERLRTGHWLMEHFLRLLRRLVGYLPWLAPAIRGRGSSRCRCGDPGDPAGFDTKSPGLG